VYTGNSGPTVGVELAWQCPPFIPSILDPESPRRRPSKFSTDFGQMVSFPRVVLPRAFARDGGRKLPTQQADEEQLIFMSPRLIDVFFPDGTP